MRKTVKICDYEIELAANAASVFRYQHEFGKDGFQEVMRLGALINGKKDNEVAEIFANGTIDFLFIYQWFWLLASTANNDILPFDKYFDQFEVQPIKFVLEALPIVMNMVVEDTKTSVKSKKK